ncbi:DUF2785 domain-containing protein [Virgibacillus salinus]|uniref:DUF2785 domain-containing protein n=1 Tax=Virgibacillus salinus TaxID=553311 RepID=A0A1H1DVR1_9BACI|nr:DUF2785 domain-containing protein [Virgibacillus salinus]SDQ80318.1 Protein of unknown function [Virgibacillus salinus]
MENEKGIKEKLHNLLSKTHIVSDDTDEYKTVLEVVSVLGSTDAELRDELGYQALIKLLIHNNYLTNYELKELLASATSGEMLFYKLGEVGSDSVFLRSFSSLLITLLLYRDNQDKFLSKSEYNSVVELVVSYCRLEKDYRDFVEGKGWAHAPAHASDAIDELVKNRHADIDSCMLLWEGITELVVNAPCVFAAEEDERIATPVLAMIEYEKVPLSTLRTWMKEIPVSEEKLHEKINVKNFSRCFSNRLIVNDSSTNYDHLVKELELQFNSLFV